MRRSDTPDPLQILQDSPLCYLEKYDNNESLNLQQGHTYEISLASASIRNGQLNIDLTGAVINPSVEVIESPADDRATITGDITRLKPALAEEQRLVYRCPECNRIVEIAKGGYELQNARDSKPR
jgi:hypothetical protein